MKKLKVMAYGLTSPTQVTLEALEAMKACGIVYCNSADTVNALRIKALGVPLVPVPGLSYPLATKKILAAFRTYSTVGFVTYGNPFFMNPPMADLLRVAGKVAEVEVLPGVSSFDALINMFGLARLRAGGVLVADLNFFMQAPVFNPAADAFLFAPFRLNAPENSRHKAAFMKKIAAAYPAGFPLFLVKCNSDPARARIVKGTVGGFAALLRRCDPEHTLIIFAGGELPAGAGITAALANAAESE